MKKSTIGIIVVAVVILAGILLWSPRENNAPSTPSASSNDISTYENSELGVSIRYPKTLFLWGESSLLAEKGVTITTVEWADKPKPENPGTDPGVSWYFIMQIDPAPLNQKGATFAEGDLTEPISLNDSDSEKIERFTLAGRPAAKFQYTFANPSNPADKIIIYGYRILDGKRLIDIVGQVDGKSKTIEDLEKVFSTFKFSE